MLLYGNRGQYELWNCDFSEYQLDNSATIGRAKYRYIFWVPFYMKYKQGVKIGKVSSVETNLFFPTEYNSKRFTYFISINLNIWLFFISCFIYIKKIQYLCITCIKNVLIVMIVTCCKSFFLLFISTCTLRRYILTFTQFIYEQITV